jgi:flagellar hook-associated protein FlgK
MNPSSIALSGMRAAELGLSTSAHNVANANTPSFRRQAVLQEEREGGGVNAGPTRLLVEGENLAEDLVMQKVAAYSFEANLRVIQTHDRMVGTLLDATA